MRARNARIYWNSVNLGTTRWKYLACDCSIRSLYRPAAFLQFTWGLNGEIKSKIHVFIGLCTCIIGQLPVKFVLFDGILSIEPQGMRENRKYAKWAKRNTDRWFLLENKSTKWRALPFDVAVADVRYSQISMRWTAASSCPATFSSRVLWRNCLPMAICST